MQEGELEGIYARVYIVPRTNNKKKVAGKTRKREARIIAYTSKHKKQRATPSRFY